MLVKSSDWSKELINQVDQIFYETSVISNFSDEKERLSFKFKYLDFYLEKYPEYCFAFLDSDKVLGYIVAATKTDQQLIHFDYYHSFENCLRNYPAHLHINCSPSYQGKGVGRKLWAHLREKLVRDKVKGLHIITTPDSRNIDFYTKNDFNYRFDIKTDSYDLTLLGISLS